MQRGGTREGCTHRRFQSDAAGNCWPSCIISHGNRVGSHSLSGQVKANSMISDSATILIRVDTSSPISA